MGVDRLIGDPGEGLEHGHAQREVRDEMVVHDIDVQPVGAGDALRLGLEVGEIGGEHARRDLDSHGWSLSTGQGDREHCIGAVDVRPPVDRLGSDDVIATGEDGIDDGARLGPVRRAGRIDDDSPGSYEVQGPAQQRLLQRDELVEVGRLPAPA